MGEIATTRNRGSFTLPLSAYLNPLLTTSAPDELLLPDEIVARFGSGLRILNPADDSAQTTCFTSGYGRSLVNAGSYLMCGDRVRRFTPEEIIRLLHFPESFSFPEGMTLRRKWGLAGNSLSVVAVREVLTAFPELFERAEMGWTMLVGDTPEYRGRR